MHIKQMWTAVFMRSVNVLNHSWGLDCVNCVVVVDQPSTDGSLNHIQRLFTTESLYRDSWLIENRILWISRSSMLFLLCLTLTYVNFIPNNVRTVSHMKKKRKSTTWHNTNRYVTTRKPCCRKETARCRKCSFRLKFANNIPYKYKTSRASKATP